MDEYGFGSRDRSQKHKTDCKFDNKIQYLLKTEEQLLQQIANRAPVPGVLNGICIALDCQIGNVVSLISLPAEGESELGSIATNAALFARRALLPRMTNCLEPWRCTAAFDAAHLLPNFN